MRQLLMTLLLLLTTGHVAAQQGLAINELFSGSIIPKERMVETRVRGRMLTDYKMSLFRSVKCKVSKEELEKINAVVQRDMASYKTTESIGDERHGRTSTLMVQLALKGKTYCYICQKTEAVGKEWVVTLIYIESTVKSLSELRKMFNNK